MIFFKNLGFLENAGEEQTSKTIAFKAPLAWSLGITLLYVVLTVYGVMNHEMWLDEYQAWLIAEKSSTVAELLWNCRYEGHPALWHLLLMGITKFSSHPLSMQLLHVSIATAGVFLFNLFSPFSRLEKILYSFSYLVFYEYALISRNYVLSVFAITVACSLYSQPGKRLIPLAVTIFILANSSVCGFVLAVGFGLFMAFDLFQAISAKTVTISKATLVAAVIIAVAGLLIAAIQMIPPSDHSFTNKISDNMNLSALETSVALQLKSFLPLPQFDRVTFWFSSIFWTNSLRNNSNLPYLALLAGALLTYSAFSLRKNISVIIFYCTSVIGVTAVQFASGSFFVRHAGFTFVAFIMALWLSSNCRAGRPPQLQTEPVSRPFRMIFVGVLLIQFIAGVYAYAMELRYPFSNMNKTAQYIRENGLSDHFLFGDLDFKVAPLSALLGKLIYFPQQDKQISFIVWKDPKVLYRTDIINKLKQQAESHDRVLVITSSADRLATDLNENWRGLTSAAEIRYVAGFEDPSICGDRLYLYETRRRIPGVPLRQSN